MQKGYSNLIHYGIVHWTIKPAAIILTSAAILKFIP